MVSFLLANFSATRHRLFHQTFIAYLLKDWAESAVPETSKSSWQGPETDKRTCALRDWSKIGTKLVRFIEPRLV